MPALEEHSPLPLYHQLEKALRERITRGELGGDSPLPGELELAGQFGVSRGTVRQALDRLVRAGVIVRRRGKGSFVVRQPVEYPLGRFYRFAHEMGSAGTSRVLGTGLGRPAADGASALGLRPADKALRVVRLRLAGDHPLLLETSFLPERLAPAFSEADLVHDSLYDILDKAGHRVDRVTERVHPIALTKSDARLLKAGAGEPAFALERTSFAGDLAVEWRTTIAPGDRITLTGRWDN